jgi:hypothetical protein
MKASNRAGWNCGLQHQTDVARPETMLRAKPTSTCCRSMGAIAPLVAERSEQFLDTTSSGYRHSGRCSAIPLPGEPDGSIHRVKEASMGDLPERVIAAHGGLPQWRHCCTGLARS